MTARLCGCGCGRPVPASRTRPAVYATPECRRRVEYAARRQHRKDEAQTLDALITRAARRGWLEPMPLPGSVELPPSWTVEEILRVHGPAVDFADDPKLHRYESMIKRIVAEGTGRLRIEPIEATPTGTGEVRAVLHVVNGDMAELACQLVEMLDAERTPARQDIQAAAEPGTSYRPTGQGVSATRYWWCVHSHRPSRSGRVADVPRPPSIPEPVGGYYDRDPRRERHLRGYIEGAT
jgi:hypothetical protein